MSVSHIPDPAATSPLGRAFQPGIPGRPIDRMTPGDRAKEQYAAEEAAELRAWRVYDLAWQRFLRLRLFNMNHARVAYLGRINAPLGPYGLIYLFHQPAPVKGPGAGEGRETVVCGATRLWLAGPEAEYPVPLLSKLTALAAGRHPESPWDLRTQLANRSDDNMAPGAVYAGLGLSSLDVAEPGSAMKSFRAANNEFDVPGVMLYLAADPNDWENDRVVVAHRRGMTDNNVMAIHSYGELGTHKNYAPYPFAHQDLPTLYQQTGFGPVLSAMRDLDIVLRRADAERRALQVPRQRRPS